MQIFSAPLDPHGIRGANNEKLKFRDLIFVACLLYEEDV